MAIIVVLAAVAIPTFGRQLETARETGDLEIIRAAYTDALAIAVLDYSDGTLDGKNGDKDFTASGALTNMTVTAPTESAGLKIKVSGLDKLKQTTAGFQFVNGYIAGVEVSGATGHPIKDDTAVEFEFKASGDSVILDNATGKTVTVSAS